MRLVLVGHDAISAGAQRMLLEIGRCLSLETATEIEFLLLGGGGLEPAYRSVADTHIVTSEAELRDAAASLAARGVTAALVNTVAASPAVVPLEAAGIATIHLVHEMPGTIRQQRLVGATRTALASARRVVFPAPFVRDAVLGEVGLPDDERMIIRPHGVMDPISPDTAGRAGIRAEFGLDPEARLVLGAGYGDVRTGFDLFLRVFRRAGPATHFCWLGDIDPGLRTLLSDPIAAAQSHAAQSPGRFHLPGQRGDVAAILAAADVLLLTSREDAFPDEPLEALAAGIPVVAFDHAGGIPDLLREQGVGYVVPHGDVAAMADALAVVVRGEEPGLPAARRRLVSEHFDWRTYVRDLGEIGRSFRPAAAVAVSAVVPNYNYARYLPQRLRSVFDQTYPISEVVVLDDCSSDDSLTVIPQIEEAEGRTVRLVANEVNSGSVFAQWRKAAELAEGDFVWIAEADDAAEPGFLAAAVALLQADPAVRLAFTDSRTIGADGTPQWGSYKEYYSTMEPDALTRTEIFDGLEFVRRFLIVKNLILNVSGVVWRREALLEALRSCEEELRGYRMAGDWRLYLEALRPAGARIGYDARPLNVNRRHATSVSQALDAQRHLAEIVRCQRAAAAAFPSIADAVAGRQHAYRREVAAQLGADLQTAEADTDRRETVR